MKDGSNCIDQRECGRVHVIRSGRFVVPAQCGEDWCEIARSRGVRRYTVRIERDLYERR